MILEKRGTYEQKKKKQNRKKQLLGLYNAVSGKQYKDPGALTVNTLENAIYMAIKNDLSFVIDSRLSLYEHQSTYSPDLPPPQFIIFYNGEEKQPDRRILKLSDLYQVEEEEHKLELEAVECTITECTREGILEEFLGKYRAEAKRMSIYEYDQARHIRQEREEAPSYLLGRDRKPAGLLAKGRSIKAGSCLRPDTGNGEGQ